MDTNDDTPLPERMTLKRTLLVSLEDLENGVYKSVRVWLNGSTVNVVKAMFFETADGECVQLILPGEGKELYARASAIVGVETDQGITARVGFHPDPLR